MTATLSIANEKRAEARYPVREDIDLKVRLTRPQYGNEGFDCLPSDLSPKGVKLSLNAMLGFDEQVVVELSSQAQELTEHLTAVVRWQRPVKGKENCWSVGLLFDEALCPESIQKLAVAGGIERRATPRTQVNVNAEIQLNSSLDRHEIQIVDVSTTGMRIQVDQDLKPGDTIRISLKDSSGEFALFGTIAWAKPSEEKQFVAGVQLRLDDSRARFIEWMKEQAGVGRKQKRPAAQSLGAIVTSAFGSILRNPLAKR